MWGHFEQVRKCLPDVITLHTCLSQAHSHKEQITTLQPYSIKDPSVQTWQQNKATFKAHQRVSVGGQGARPHAWKSTPDPPLNISRGTLEVSVAVLK